MAPSAEAAAVVESLDASSAGGSTTFAYDINRTTDRGGRYPIVLVSYHIGCSKDTTRPRRDLVKGFLGYVISSEGQQAAAQAAGSAPLTDELRTQITTAVDAISAGA